MAGEDDQVPPRTMNSPPRGPRHLAKRHRPSRRPPRWLVLPIVAVVVIVVVIVVLVQGPAKKKGPPSDPLAGKSLFVNPATPAATQVEEWLAQGQKAEATALEPIADHQFGFWLADDAPSTIAQATTLVARSAAHHQLPLLVLYDIPDRDCGGYSSGGAPSNQAYITFIEAVTSAIGVHPAIVILEPDEVAEMASGCVPQNTLAGLENDLSTAVRILRTSPGTDVYMDAGNPGWIQNTHLLSRLLRASGVLTATGFSLNVANFQTLASNLEYGGQLSSLLNGEHFVVDTSRNGNGPFEASTNQQGWCNPPGRKIGVFPTTSTGVADVDAYLWIKEPGESDGTCRGGPPAGTWWPAYALSLVR